MKLMINERKTDKALLLDDETPSINRLSSPNSIIIGIDWKFLQRISIAQLACASLSTGFMLISQTVCGFDSLRSIISITWQSFLIIGAIIGHEAGKWLSYPCAIVANGFWIVQLIVSIPVICAHFLVYISYYVSERRDTRDICQMRNTYPTGWHFNNNLMQLPAIGEFLSLIVTVIIGTIGLIECCRAFGRLINFLEQKIKDKI